MLYVYTYIYTAIPNDTAKYSKVPEILLLLELCKRIFFLLTVMFPLVSMFSASVYRNCCCFFSRRTFFFVSLNKFTYDCDWFSVAERIECKRKNDFKFYVWKEWYKSEIEWLVIDSCVFCGTFRKKNEKNLGHSQKKLLINVKTEFNLKIGKTDLFLHDSYNKKKHSFFPSKLKQKKWKLRTKEFFKSLFCVSSAPTSDFNMFLALFSLSGYS